MEELKHQLRPDLMLYEAFLKKFRTEISLFGKEKMENFVKQLDELNQYIHIKCKLEAIVDADLMIYTAGYAIAFLFPSLISSSLSSFQVKHNRVQLRHNRFCATHPNVRKRNEKKVGQNARRMKRILLASAR